MQGTLIIGGGAIGLALGWRLLLRGEAVVLLERQETGREASWASAGLLAVSTKPANHEDPHVRMRRESQALYPDFVAELESTTGEKIDYRTHGTLYVALIEEELDELRRLHQVFQERPAPTRWVEGAELRTLEPALSQGAVAGVLNTADTQLDNRRFVAALRSAFIKAGGELHEHTPVESVRMNGEGPPTVLAGGREWQASKIVLAAGAWSGLIPGFDGVLRQLVWPVKGQILALKAPEGTIRHAVVTSDAYLAPREDGRIVVGATLEEKGFDPDITVGAVYELLRAAQRAMPVARDWQLYETWCGFRPGSRDGAPILGKSGIPGLYLATGHFRSGIVNTAYTAKVLTDLLLDDSWPDWMEAFSPDRFT